VSAKNHNAGKPKWSLLLTDFADELREVLRVREVIEASGKYDRMNFAQSQGKPEAKVFLEDNLDSMERHIFDRRKNKHIDHETKCYHMAHLCIRSLIDLSYALHDKQALSDEECEDILQEDVSLQCIETRFDWSNAPSHAKYAAIDCDGEGWWYPTRPKLYLKWFWGAGTGEPIGDSMLREGEDWRTTLEARPSRYPWEDAPCDAKYAAIDCDGGGWWYTIRPKFAGNWFWGAGKFIGISMLREGEDWKTTLEERPK
jgi:hypothetical protein